VVLWAITIVAFVEAIYNAYAIMIAAQKGSVAVLLNFTTFGVAAIVCIGSLLLQKRQRL
jgi:hypothetical protein